MPGESYRRQVRSLLLCSCYVFRVQMEALKTCCGSQQTECKELKESLLAGHTVLQTESKATADVLQELKNEKRKVCAAYARSVQIM